MIKIPIRKTAKAQATQIQKAIQGYLAKHHNDDKYGYPPENVILRENEEYSSWDVIWEEGPFDWGHSFLGEEGIFSNEGFGPMTPEFDVTAIRNNPFVTVDLMNSFTISVN